jgi:hypothetical protein
MSRPGILIEINPRWLFAGFEATRQLNGAACKILFWNLFGSGTAWTGRYLPLFQRVPETGPLLSAQ